MHTAKKGKERRNKIPARLITEATETTTTNGHTRTVKKVLQKQRLHEGYIA
jgi:hypothetical protein